MNIFITGGTGFVGSYLVAKLVAQGDSVTVLTRSVPREGGMPGVSYIGGDPAEEGAWQFAMAEHDAVINLAGASIFGRWSAAAKREIRRSRIRTTVNIVNGLSSGTSGKSVTLLNCSAIGFYGSRGNEVITEETPGGQGFLAEVVKAWEEAALVAKAKGVRVVLCRLGVVLGGKGGALGMMLPAFKWGLGSPLGTGRQWFSWIHIDDLARVFLFLLRNIEITGPVNCTAPGSVTNRQLSEALGRVLGRPVFLPAVPAFVLKILLGEFSSVLLEGQQVLPAKLLAGNFSFQYTKIDEALANLTQRP